MIATRSSVLSPEKPLAFCIVTWQALSFLYYYLTSPKLSVLSPDKPQTFCIITWQAPSSLHYHLTNPNPSVLLPGKPQVCCIITWQTPSLLYYYLTYPNRKPWPIFLTKMCLAIHNHHHARTKCYLLEAWCCFNQIIDTYVKQSVNIYEIKFV